jgi:hypothetical protein
MHKSQREGALARVLDFGMKQKRIAEVEAREWLRNHLEKVSYGSWEDPKAKNRKLLGFWVGYGPFTMKRGVPRREKRGRLGLGKV